MGKTKEMAAEISEYFTLMTDEEWQQHLIKCEDYIHDRYGHGLHATLKLAELLKRKDNGKK
jgi:hypothetical protein